MSACASEPCAGVGGVAGVRVIAALFVERNGAYFGRDDVDPWDEKRDARKYAGPWPVVTHPPCSRWCQLAGLVEARWGHKRGEDDGCFKAALGSVRRFKGVLEHPAYTKAWPAFGLPKPPKTGWLQAPCGGWVTHVEQGSYGHPCRKATWLYAYGCELPTLDWTRAPPKSYALVSNCANHIAPDTRRRLIQKPAARTPPAFREILIEMAKSAGRNNP